MTDSGSRKPSSRRVLPVVVDMCNRVNEVFVRYVGPIADDVAVGAYESWLELGNTGPSGVGHYINLLSGHITDEQQRRSFGDEARVAMRNALERRR
ncbi:MAG: hypothetical protein WAL83_08490 [Arenicellales bacterium]|jgi:hypothetical protein